MKSSLRLDSRYNVAFIQVQTVLYKHYISRYVSYAEYYRVITITRHQSASGAMLRLLVGLSARMWD